MQSTEQLLIIAGIMIGAAGVFVFSILKGLYSHFKFSYNIKKGYKKEKEKIAKFKEEGGVHKWVSDVAVRLPDGKIVNTHVCEHTGYCPAIEGFVPLSHIKNVIHQRKTEEEYKEYKSKEIVRITQQYDLPCGEVTRCLVEEILSMKKNFHLNKMEQFKADIKKQFGDKVKIVSNMDELDEALREVKNEKSSEIS